MAAPILTSPDPIGIGTAACESLTSYVQRLAQLHQVAPSQILYRVLTWCEAGDLRGVGKWRERPRRLRTGNFNAFKHADAWVRALQRATGRANLHHLTTRGWDHNFPSRGFLATHLRWCPLCLSEDNAPYHRLSWMLTAVRCCDLHERWLAACCARCGRSIPVFHERSWTVLCPLCGADLRNGGPQQTPSAFELRCTHEAEAIIAAAASSGAELTWAPQVALTSLARRNGVNTPGALASQLHMSKITVWYWLNGRAQPSFPSALEITSRLNASLAALLGAPRPFVRQLQQPEFHLTGRAAARARDWPKIDAALRAELQSTTPKSLRQFGALHGIAVRTLRAHLPARCAELARHRLKQQQLLRRSWENAALAELRPVASRLVQGGLPLTPANLEEALCVIGYFNRRAPRRALHVLKAEF